MRLAISTILPSAVPWILLGVVSILSLSRPSSSHPELVEQQRPLFRPPPSDAVVLERASLISEDTYGRLERFAKYASAAYQVLCPHPLGNTLVQSVSLLLLALTRPFFVVPSFYRCIINDFEKRDVEFLTDRVLVLEYAHARARVRRARRWAARDRRCVSGESRAGGYGHRYVYPIR